MQATARRHIYPLLILLLAIFVVYLFDISDHLTLSYLKEKEREIVSWIRLHPFLAIPAFISVYTLSVCLLLPTLTLLTLLVAWVYPMPYAFALSVLSETLGASIFFIILRYVPLPEIFLRKLRYWNATKSEFRSHPASYLLFLRFSHFTPSWVVSVIAALFKTPLRTFVWTTLVGTAPICYVIIQAENTIRHLQVEPSSRLITSSLFNEQTRILLLGMAFLALVPIAIKKILRR